MTSFLSESSTAPSVMLPASGQYFCLSKDLAICNDGVAMLDLNTELFDQGTTVVPATSGDISWRGVTLSTARQSVYYLQYDRVSDTNTVETIRRVSTKGGPPTTVVTAPLNTGIDGVELGAPQVSPDGRFLAYVITVGLAGAKAYAMPVGAHVVVLDVAPGTGAESPITVPETMTGPRLPDTIFGGYQLAGWSPDDRSLYYFGGLTHDLKVVTFDSTGHPQNARTLYRPAPPEGRCPDGDEGSAMTPAGDVLFTTYCQVHGVTIERLHDGSVTTFASVPELTGGWLVNQLFADTTGRVVQLDEDVLDVDCLSGTAHIVFLDGLVVAKQIQTNGQGCPPGAQLPPASTS